MLDKEETSKRKNRSGPFFVEPHMIPGKVKMSIFQNPHKKVYERATIKRKKSKIARLEPSFNIIVNIFDYFPCSSADN